MDAETKLIACCLLKKGLIDKVLAAGVITDWFTEPIDLRVWTEMVDMIDKGKPVDQLWADDLAKRLDSSEGVRYTGTYAEILSPTSECMSAVEIMRQRYGRKGIDRIVENVRRRLDTEDPEMLAKETIEQLSDLVPTSTQESSQDIVEKIRHELDVGVVCPTGYNQLDYYVNGIEAGVLWMVGGHTSHGKTNFALNIAYNLVSNAHPVTYFSTEMSKKQLIKRVATMESGINPPPWSMTPEEKDTYMSGVEKALSLPLSIYQTFSLPEIRMAIRNQQSTLYVVDYLQMLDPGIREDNEVKRLGYIVRELERLSKEYDVCIIATSQFKRSNGDAPCLYSYRGSGEIEENTDIGILLYYPYQQASSDDQKELGDKGWDRRINVEVRKNRIHGRNGRMKFDFDRKTMRIKGISEKKE